MRPPTIFLLGVFLVSAAACKAEFDFHALAGTWQVEGTDATVVFRPDGTGEFLDHGKVPGELGGPCTSTPCKTGSCLESIVLDQGLRQSMCALPCTTDADCTGKQECSFVSSPSKGLCVDWMHLPSEPLPLTARTDPFNAFAMIVTGGAKDGKTLGIGCRFASHDAIECEETELDKLFSSHKLVRVGSGDGGVPVTTGPGSVVNVRKNAKAGDSVALENVVVLGVRKPVGSSNGFYVSDANPGPWSCIFVHTGATPPANAVGDVLDISGDYAVVDGLAQVQQGANIKFVASGNAPAELDTTVAQLIGAEAASFQSCRVRLQMVKGVAMSAGVGVSQSGSQIAVSPFIFSGSSFVTSGTWYTQLKGFVNVRLGAPEVLPQTDGDLVK